MLFVLTKFNKNILNLIAAYCNFISRLFFGKNKVIAIALGKDAKHEIADNIHRVSEKLVNEVGVLFTSKPKEDVLE